MHVFDTVQTHSELRRRWNAQPESRGVPGVRYGTAAGRLIPLSFVQEAWIGSAARDGNSEI